MLFLQKVAKSPKYGQPFERCIPEHPDEIEKARAFTEQHYAVRICLAESTRCAGLSKSDLLRTFAKSKGVMVMDEHLNCLDCCNARTTLKLC